MKTIHLTDEEFALLKRNLEVALHSRLKTIQVLADTREADYAEDYRVKQYEPLNHLMTRIEESKASDKLIEAAPELLEALKSTLGAMKDIVHQLPVDESLANYNLDWCEAAEQKAEAAIQKATE